MSSKVPKHHKLENNAIFESVVSFKAAGGRIPKVDSEFLGPLGRVFTIQGHRVDYRVVITPKNGSEVGAYFSLE